MSKKLNTSQSNTLLNYFQSPKASATPKASPQPKIKEKTPKSSVKNEIDDEPIQPTKKRKKIALITSDSEDEENTPKKTNKFAKRVKTESSSEEDEPKTPKRKVKNDKTETPNHKICVSNIGDIHSNWLHNNLSFLNPDNIRDINKNRPDHPEYDPRTLYVPKDFLEKQTPAMRQWWILKSTHMDSVIFFKVGKFYELYHMDATVGVTQLGFSYMKGEFAHSGFPESAYHKMANALISKGFKVARTEQTETPEMMAERCKKQVKTTKFDKVVNREICQVSTKATCVYTAQLPEAMSPFACFMFAITEKDITMQIIKFGVCFIDTSIGVFHLCEFEDDKHCSKLLSLFSEFSPGLILTERRRMSPKLKQILNTYFKDVRKDTLASESQFYSADTTIEKLLNGGYFLDKNDKLCIPEFIKNISDGYSAKSEYELMIKSLGACLWYLNDSKLDIQIVSMGKFLLYEPLNLINKNQIKTKHFMILDSVTTCNLNLLGGEGSLQKTIDFCQTAFGKRLLLQWICRPLCDVEKIQERQDAIKELYQDSTLLKATQDILKKLPDLDRQVTKIHMYGNKFFAKNHPDSRAVFYEAATYSKRRINDLLKTLQAFEISQELDSLFKNTKSSLLKKITQFQPIGTYVDLSDLLQFFKGAFDQKQAQEEGKIIPKLGVNEDYDNSEKNIEEIKNKLKKYLTEQQKFFGCKVTYFGSDKKRFQLDIPEPYAKNVSSDYQLEGIKKGNKPSKRFSTPETRQFLADMLRAESERTKIIQDLNRCIFEKFSEKRDQWEQVIQCLTTLDVICSLAEYARTYPQDICVPIIKPFSDSNTIVVKNGRHPCVSNIDTFIPNDVEMGTEEHAGILLITGPNMGGKSTLMRQIAIITVMAQIGSFVPATYCELNLIDRIFTRLGAQDDIMQGQSTFLVELTEASCILQHATQFSLVLLDELGRGTSTHDGNAIATAYVRKLTEINCRTLFSTHYHSLVDYFIGRTDVQLGHMACMVENSEDPKEESITFLYKMANGRCPKSYGFNVARLAGLKHSIVARGREIAKELEEEAKNRNVFSKLFKSDIFKIRDLISSLHI